MIHRYKLFILLLGLLSFSFFTVTAEQLLYQKGRFQFTQSNASHLLEMAEFIGGSHFSAKDAKALQLWAIEDFKNAPKVSMNFYKSLSKVTIPKIRKSKGNNVYRAELYLSFDKHPEYRKNPDNFLSIIDRYKPPIQDALLIRQIRFNAVMQQMQLNQRVFNQAMRQSQRASDAIGKSISDQATRDAITLPGGKILHESGGKIYAEDYKGQKFEVTK